MRSLIHQIFCGSLKIFCLVLIFQTSSSTNAQNIVSLHAIFNEQNAKLLPHITGKWNNADFGVTLSILQAGDNFYKLQYESKEEQLIYEAVFIQADSFYFLDLRRLSTPSGDKTDNSHETITTHSIYKISALKVDTIKLSELNYTWCWNYAMKDKMPLAFEWLDGGMLLTGDARQIVEWLDMNHRKPGMFNSPILLTRDKVSERISLPVSQDSIPYGIMAAACLPQFPLQDGWLGGDGDASVQLNQNTTLFIFSDSYVGNKNDAIRSRNMGMVSNTLALQTCRKDGTIQTQYYWKQQYSATPKPFFSSGTNRYRFWVTDAFTANNELYVLLEKIGPKKGVAPNDIFNFSQMGKTLVKIVNPLAPPDSWKMEMMPMPEFTYPEMNLQCHAVSGNFVYYFLSSFDRTQHLVRKPLEAVSDPSVPYEYYACNHQWKKGVNRSDMDTLITGFRCNTVNYHEDIKSWVMVNDIQFMDTVITIRTAPALTGPWSEAIAVYSIPEVSRGSKVYDAHNFCYLARECPQNYDSTKHEMVMTYDINNSDFETILKHASIYTPKVIRVRLNGNKKLKK